MAKINGDFKVERLIYKRKNKKTGTSWEYLVQCKPDDEAERNMFVYSRPFVWLKEDDLIRYNCEDEIEKFEKACDIIKRCNIDVYNGSVSPENLRFGFEKTTVDHEIEPVEVCDVFEYENVRICEVRWNKPIATDDSECVDFVSYHELAYRKPNILIEWFDKKFKDAPSVTSENPYV